MKFTLNLTKAQFTALDSNAQIKALSKASKNWIDGGIIAINDDGVDVDLAGVGYADSFFEFKS